MRFLVFFLTFLYAFDLVDVYRFQGEDTLSKKIESLLASPNFWKNKIKDYNVTFGYFQNQKDILVCVKDKKILDVYKYNKNLKLLDSIKVLTGLDGDKLKEGVLKTPIGVYSVIGFPSKINEANIKITKSKLIKRFSVDKNKNIYRAEIYDKDSFCGMILVDFGGENENSNSKF